MVSNPNPCRLCLEARKGHLGIKSIDLACILSAVEGRDMFGDCAERIKSESAATRLLPLRATFARRTLINAHLREWCFPACVNPRNTTV